jgi:hypothetical protein
VPNPKETSIGALLSGAAVAVGSAVSLADATVDDIAVANRLPAPGWDPYGWWMSLSEDPPYDAPNGAQPTRPTIRAFFSNHPGEVSKLPGGNHEGHVHHQSPALCSSGVPGGRPAREDNHWSGPAHLHRLEDRHAVLSPHHQEAAIRQQGGRVVGTGLVQRGAGAEP